MVTFVVRAELGNDSPIGQRYQLCVDLINLSSTRVRTEPRLLNGQSSAYFHILNFKLAWVRARSLALGTKGRQLYSSPIRAALLDIVRLSDKCLQPHTYYTL